MLTVIRRSCLVVLALTLALLQQSRAQGPDKIIREPNRAPNVEKPAEPPKVVKAAKAFELTIESELTNIDPLDDARSSYQKVHSLELPGGATYEIRVTGGPTLTPTVKLYQDKNLLAESKSTGAKSDSAALKHKLGKAGKYQLHVSTAVAKQVGKYTLTVREFKYLDLEITDKITNNDPFDAVRQQHHCKVHTVEMQAGKTYQIDMMSAFDTYLRLEDSAQKQLTADDDGGEGLNSRITFVAPKDDTYRVIATTYGAGATGEYKLTVRQQKDVEAVFNVRDKLTMNDGFDVVRQQHHCKIHVLKMEKGKTYQIDMRSSDFDSYLRLEDAGMQQLAADDDGGGFPHARIVYTAQKDEMHRIIATTFAGGAIGEYQITVTQK